MPIVVLVSVPPDKAHEFARTLVSERLAACVNIVGPMHSVYRWQGEVAEDSESLLLIKTEDHCYAELERRVAAMHPYNIPEIISLPVGRALPSYLTWLASSVTRPES